jgi:CRISPR/Cas system-associated endoribonuclease Cas2
MKIIKNDKASIRIWAQNPDHHLYCNNGTYWVHYTAFPTAVTSQRVRKSLKTHDLEVARERRDSLLAKLFFESKEVA